MRIQIIRQAFARYYSSNAEKTLRLALVQLNVSTSREDRALNVSRAISFVEKAKQRGADIVVLPEVFSLTLNLPFATAKFQNYTENVPDGETCLALSKAAKDNEILIVGGSVFEKMGNNRCYNTCTIWNSEGELIGKYRKIHLFDVDVKGKVTVRESNTSIPGDKMTTFSIKGWKIGLGICYDLRFEELARLYRNLGCHVLLYPGAFNETTGPIHWSLLQRARAVDNQVYVAGISIARDTDHGVVAYGHTSLADPWGNVIEALGYDEGMIVADLDMTVIDAVREQIPIFKQRRTDLYNTVWTKN